MMEWLQWGHDFSVVDIYCESTRSVRKKTGFNGATTFQSWICRPNILLRAPPLRFNGATTFQSWIYDGGHCLTRCCGASMGPRLFSRGYKHSLWSWRKTVIGFNGATTFQSWICCRRVRQSAKVICFNGATTFQSWILSAASVY